MKKIIFSKQADCDAELLPLWYWWYTNVFPVDQFIILAASVRSVTKIDQVREFWKDKKNVIYHEKLYDEWFAPKVWEDQRAQVKKLLPPTNYLALSVDLDEFFEYPDEDQLKGLNAIAFTQARFWSPKTPTLDNIKDLQVFDLKNGGDFLSNGSVRRGGFINNMNHSQITTTGLIKNAPISGLYFFHFHFRGIEWFKNKFGKMKYAVQGPGASRHWKNYTAFIQRTKVFDTYYEKLLNNSNTSIFVSRFKNYFK